MKHFIFNIIKLIKSSSNNGFHNIFETSKVDIKLNLEYYEDCKKNIIKNCLMDLRKLYKLNQNEIINEVNNFKIEINKKKISVLEDKNINGFEKLSIVQEIDNGVSAIESIKKAFLDSVEPNQKNTEELLENILERFCNNILQEKKVVKNSLYEIKNKIFKKVSIIQQECNLSNQPKEKEKIKNQTEEEIKNQEEEVKEEAINQKEEEVKEEAINQKEKQSNKEVKIQKEDIEIKNQDVVKRKLFDTLDSEKSRRLGTPKLKKKSKHMIDLETKKMQMNIITPTEKSDKEENSIEANELALRLHQNLDISSQYEPPALSNPTTSCEKINIKIVYEQMLNFGFFQRYLDLFFEAAKTDKGKKLLSLKPENYFDLIPYVLVLEIHKIYYKRENDQTEWNNSEIIVRTHNNKCKNAAFILKEDYHNLEKAFYRKKLLFFSFVINKSILSTDLKDKSVLVISDHLKINHTKNIVKIQKFQCKKLNFSLEEETSPIFDHKNTDSFKIFLSKDFIINKNTTFNIVQINFYHRLKILHHLMCLYGSFYYKKQFKKGTAIIIETANFQFEDDLITYIPQYDMICNGKECFDLKALTVCSILKK
ncbi:hypothetical protein NUSPORA_01997 [Nucleospora cyclopteri]